MKRCVRCILPESYPNISFDSDGVCNVCHSFEQRWGKYNWDKKREEFESIVANAKSKKEGMIALCRSVVGRTVPLHCMCVQNYTI